MHRSKVTPCGVSGPAQISDSGEEDGVARAREVTAQPEPSTAEADAAENNCVKVSASTRRCASDDVLPDEVEEDEEAEEHPLASKLFDAIDMNSNGQVSPDEIADFVSTLMWAYDDVNSLKVVELLREVASQMLRDGPPQDAALAPEDQRPKKEQFTSSDMPALLEALSRSKELSLRLAHTELLANTFLVRQFINMEYEEKVSVLSWYNFFLSGFCMQILPLTLLLAKRQKKWAYQSRWQTVVHNVNQLFTHRVLNICSKLPFASRIGDRLLPCILPMVSLTYACIYASMLYWWIVYGPYIRADASSTADFVTFLDPSRDVGVFEAHLPWLMLQLMIMGGSAKVAIKDVDGVDKLSRAVSELGDLNKHLLGDCGVSGKGGRRWTSGAVLVEIQQRVCDAKEGSLFLKGVEGSAFVVPLALTAANRVLRILLVGNFWSTGSAAGPFVALTNVIFNTLLLSIWWQEVMEIIRFLTDQRIRAQIFSKLFSTGEARAARLPCLKRQCPEDLILWAKLRYYIQQPNPIEMRWIELFVAGVLIFALAACALVLVTLFQGTLLKHSYRNGDVQALSIFIALISVCLVLCILNNIFTAVSIGNVYREDLQRLAKEIFDTQCWITLLTDKSSPSCQGAGFLSSADAGGVASTSHPHHSPSCGGGGGTLSSRAWSQTYCSHPTLKARFPRMQDLRDYTSVLEKIMTLLQMSSEYIELFGIPIDARLRNTVLSVFLTVGLAVLSSAVGLIIKQIQAGT